MPYIVETRNLVRSFKGQDKPVVTLNNVSISIEEGEILELLGPNGAGKAAFKKSAHLTDRKEEY